MRGFQCASGFLFGVITGFSICQFSLDLPSLQSGCLPWQLPTASSKSTLDASPSKSVIVTPLPKQSQAAIPAKPPPTQKPGKFDKSSVDVWFWQALRAPMVFKDPGRQTVYTPIITSYGEAFQAMGATVATVYLKNSTLMLEGIQAAVAKGRKPLLITMAYTVGWFKWFSEFKGTPCTRLRQAASMGAYVVAFQTEPHTEFEVAGHVFNVTQHCQVHEVWEYSKANLEQYQTRIQQLGHPVRYLPPGYSTASEAGVNLDSAERNERVVGFLGNLELRPKEVQAALAAPFWRQRINQTFSVWKRYQLAQFVSRSPLQLNVHKQQTCCPSKNAMEAFRMADLLANKACVLSAAVHPEDMAVWSDLVSFFNTFDEAQEKVTELSKDVKACQLRAYEAYKRRFDPRRLLEDSGFLSVWRPPQGI